MMLNNKPAKVLGELVKFHGFSLCADSKRCKALLMDSCGEYKREINVLIGALLLDVPTELMSSGEVPEKMLKNRLASKLCAELAITKQAANWSVEAWSAAIVDCHGDKIQSEEEQSPEAEKLICASSDAQQTISDSECSHATQKRRLAARPRTIRVPVKGDLIKAVESARPGDTIRLNKGTYSFDSALRIKKSIIFQGQGAEETVILLQNTDAQLLFNGDCAWQLEGISIKTFCGSGVIFNGGKISITGCHFTSTHVTGVGIVFFTGCSGQVSNCIFSDNHHAGIVMSGNSIVELINNKFIKNTYGVIYSEDATGTAKTNKFRSNDYGIFLTDRASPLLEKNTCSRNKAGIAYKGKSAGRAYKNKCSNNNIGILVEGQAKPELSNNKCIGNKDAGMVYLDNARGSALNNDCSGNQGDGICVSGISAPRLECNTCSENSNSGIVYKDNSSGQARENTCLSNSSYGIYISEDASPKLKDNRVSNSLKGQIYPDLAKEQELAEDPTPPAAQGPPARFWLFSLLAAVCLSWLVFSYLSPSIFVLKEITGFWSRIAYIVRLTGPYVVFAGGLAGTCLYNYRRSYPNFLYSVFAWGGGTIIAGLTMYTYVLPAALVVILPVIFLVVSVYEVASDSPEYFTATLLAASALSALVFFFIHPHESLFSRSIIASTGIVASITFNYYSIMEYEENYFLSIVSSALTLVIVGVLIYLLPIVTWAIIGLYGLLLLALVALSIWFTIDLITGKI